MLWVTLNLGSILPRNALQEPRAGGMVEDLSLAAWVVWVLHAVKAFTSPHLGVSPRNWCWGNRI